MDPKPRPRICYRTIDETRLQAALTAGFDPWVAKIMASRPSALGMSIEDILLPKLKTLDNPEKLPDIARASERLIRAFENNEVIGVETDHDCDGQTSHAVIYSALTEFLGHPEARVKSYIGHRLKEGYGLSEKVVERILMDEPRPTLVITADNGSSDEPRIARLKEHGIDVIVTDHHEIPQEGIPQSAYAVINPIRSDSNYPDRAIAGCMVAWLFMAYVRQQWALRQEIEISSLASLLDFVAVGTIADCVSMAKSRNNRAVVNYGMKLIERAMRPCWQALKPFLSDPLSSEDLGFKIGPLLNSDGRLACAFGSVSFLLAKDLDEAERWTEHLQLQNQERKAIQDKMSQDAIIQAKKQYQEGRSGLCLFLENGHPGVHGICASRVKEAFGRPVVIFSPKNEDPDRLTGSARSIDGLHLRQVLQTIHDMAPDVIERFGGHQGAAGLSLYRHNLEVFSTLFEAAVSQKVDPNALGPVIYVDGALPISELNYPYIKKLVSQLEPFGREFEPPLFEVFGKVISLTPVGKQGIHARLGLVVEELWLETIWFSARENKDDPWPVMVGEQVRAIYSPKLQIFRGESKVSCQVVDVRAVA